MSEPTAMPPEQPARLGAAARPIRKMPNMRVVTKGWWVLHEESVPLEVLQQEDRDNEKANDKSPIGDRRTGADLIAAIQVSPDRDIDLAPPRMKMPVSDVRL